ncbi:MAG TPA: hypothetical protein VLK84_05110, partial [Longimicrobium sp.]|nr:hypothetical protein [Longimicrobium sp.]
MLVHLPDLTFQDTAAHFCARAMATRHLDPAAAVALADRAVLVADGEHGRRRARAVLGACLSLVPGQAWSAREILRDSLGACVAAGDDALRCTVLNELAGSAIATYEFDAARGYARQAAELARGLGLPAEEARGLRLLGSAHSATGAFAEALPILLQALDL